MNQRQLDESIDAEQIEKTLNFFDAILDPYLNDVDMKSVLSPRPINLRRYTSENSLNHITTSVSTTTKSSYTRPLRTTATSTEDLTTVPSEWTKKLNALSTNMVSASLIDLSSIDKTSSRPRFRFVPPSSNSTETLKEEPELEHEYHLKIISAHPPTMTMSKPSHPIVKPIVIIPAVVKSAPINRLTETNIHHQNGNSAFKPHRASKTGVSAKIHQTKRAESTQKLHVQTTKTHMDNHPLLRHQQSMPQTHQSMLNLTSFKSNGYPPPAPARAMLFDDPVLRRIQQVNNSSSIHGLVHSENRPPQTNHPYGSYLSANNNNRRHQGYYHPPPPPPKYQASPSIYVQRNTGLPVSSNVYHFHPNQSPRNASSKRQSHYQNATITTYL